MNISVNARARSALALLVALLVLTVAGACIAASYPPPVERHGGTHQPSQPPGITGLLFTNTHLYGPLTIRVDVYDNYFGDFSKYWWVYSVTNLSYDPSPTFTNGFSGFETALPSAVPDIADIATPGPAWWINCCSGQPVEYDVSDVNGPGVMPGFSGVFSFTTLPRLIIPSTGWYHSWLGGGQVDVTYYPAGNEPEVPDVISNPGEELCCYKDASGAYVCQILPAGQCTSIGGNVISNCNDCPPVPVEPKSWGEIKGLYRN